MVELPHAAEGMVIGTLWVLTAASSQNFQKLCRCLPLTTVGHVLAAVGINHPPLAAVGLPLHVVAAVRIPLHVLAAVGINHLPLAAVGHVLAAVFYRRQLKLRRSQDHGTVEVVVEQFSNLIFLDRDIF